MTITAIDERYSTPRIKRLNQRLVDFIPEISDERALIYTEVYQQTEGEPRIIRQAKALKKTLEEMRVYILDEELIVGQLAKTPRSAQMYPETEALYFEREMDLFEIREQDRCVVRNEVKKNLREKVIPYWKEKCVEAIAPKMVPEESKKLRESRYKPFNPEILLRGHIGHACPDYESIIKEGLKKKKEKIKKKMTMLDLASIEDLEKWHFYEAELIVYEGVVNFIKRYASEAKELAQKEKHINRKQELERIAEICNWIAENPPRDFHGGVQLVFFLHMIFFIEQDGVSQNFGRLDQFLYPLYKKDKEEGEITREKAREILECFWIKMTEIIRAYDSACAQYYAGFSMTENVTIGGMTEDGKDAVNELSFICLEAHAGVQTTQPNLCVRINPKTPHDFLLKVAEVVRLGRGQPSIFNDEIAIPSLIEEGASFKDARNYYLNGCVEPIPPDNFGQPNTGYFNLAKTLELAMNNGKCIFSGQQLGPQAGYLKDFNSFEELMEAFKKQISYLMKHLVILVNANAKALQEVAPLPYFSMMTAGCIEKGKDVMYGGAKYNYTGIQGVGIPDVADSLAALKKLVFEEKAIGKEELQEALFKNFEGQEILRQQLLNNAPKYGNDEEFADLIAKEVSEIFSIEVKKYKNIRGGQYRPGWYTISGHVPLSFVVGALPSGKKAKELLTDSISPVHGVDSKGPTAVCISATRLDHMKATNGLLLNFKFSPKTLVGEKGLNNWVALIRTYFDQGGREAQFNVVNSDTLKDAQKNPEKHKGLTVRVAGYSAYFVELDPGVQQDIITRTEYDGF